MPAGNFSGDLIDEPVFVQACQEDLESLHRLGAQATLQNLVKRIS